MRPIAVALSIILFAAALAFVLSKVLSPTHDSRELFEKYVDNKVEIVYRDSTGTITDTQVRIIPMSPVDTLTIDDLKSPFAGDIIMRKLNGFIRRYNEER